MYRVALVDDSPQFLAWLWSVLDGSGDFAPVGQAANGKDAIELIGRLAPDIAIVDVDLPEVDGLQVAARVHQQNSSTRVVLVTGHTDQTYASLAAQAGAFAFIPKAKLSMETLRRAVEPSASS
jgi:YesN/AraC family two-component response regulator